MIIKSIYKEYNLEYIKMCDQLFINFLLSEKKYDFNIKILDNYESFKKDILDKNAFINVMVEEGKVIAFIYLCIVESRKQEDKIGKICFVYVEEKYRSKGVATKLVESSIDLFRKQGISIIEVKSFVENKEANSLYKKFNFKPLWQSYRKLI